MTRELWLQRVAALARALASGHESSPLDVLAEALPSLPRPVPAVGQLWRVTDASGQGAPTLVILTHVAAMLRGVVALEHTWAAGHDDLVLQADYTPTGRPLMACTWSDTPIPPTALAGCVGAIAARSMEPLLMVLQRQITGGFRLRAREVMDGNLENGAVLWEVWPVGDRGATRSFMAGPRILDETDPRVRLHEVVEQRTAWLGEAATTAIGEHAARTEERPLVGQLIDRLRAALEKLGLPTGVDAPAPTSLAGRLAGEALAGAVMGVVLQPAIAAAVRAAYPGRTAAGERFSAMVGAVTVVVSVDVSEDGVSLAVRASEGRSPFKGLHVALTATDHRGERLRVEDRTDESGMSWIAPQAVDCDEPIKIVLGRGEGRRVVIF